jgi:hypothetical protein
MDGCRLQVLWLVCASFSSRSATHLLMHYANNSSYLQNEPEIITSLSYYTVDNYTVVSLSLA